MRERKNEKRSWNANGKENEKEIENGCGNVNGSKNENVNESGSGNANDCENVNGKKNASRSNGRKRRSGNATNVDPSLVGRNDDQLHQERAKTGRYLQQQEMNGRRGALHVATTHRIGAILLLRIEEESMSARFLLSLLPIL